MGNIQRGVIPLPEAFCPVRFVLLLLVLHLYRDGLLVLAGSVMHKPPDIGPLRILVPAFHTLDSEVLHEPKMLFFMMNEVLPHILLISHKSTS